MPGRRARNAGNDTSKEQLSREMRRSKLTLFMQQFEKEAQERMNELEAKIDNMLATVDKVFKVELMKMPPALKKTRMGDLINEEVSASDVSIAIKNESCELPQPLKRMPSKRIKSTESPPLQSTPGPRSSSKTTKLAKGSKRKRTLVGSNSTGNLTGSSSAGSRTRSCLTRTASTQAMPSQTKPKLRSVVSAGDMHCMVAGAAAHVTVTTGRGQTVSFSEETKNEINWDLLDDVAMFQIQRLTSLMENVSQRKMKDI